MALAYYYAKVLRAPGPKDWAAGITKCMQVFELPKGSRGSVEAVFEDIRECILHERQYSGVRKRNDHFPGGIL